MIPDLILSCAAEQAGAGLIAAAAFSAAGDRVQLVHIQFLLLFQHFAFLVF